MSEPIHIISLGAGVQSSTMALMAARGKITPMPHCAIFADTQSEPKKVYEWLDWLKTQLPFPVITITRGSLTEAITKLHQRKDKNGYWLRAAIPAFTLATDGSRGMVPRQCTYQFKVEILDRECRKIAGIKRGQKTIGVVQWIGISIDEVYRVKQPRNPWQEFKYPIIEAGMSRDACLRWMYDNGFPRPPRSACVYCPYKSDYEWLQMKDNFPEEFAEAVRVDYAFREARKATLKITSEAFLHSSRVPLDKVEFNKKYKHDDRQLNLFNNECEGMCGV